MILTKVDLDHDTAVENADAEGLHIVQPEGSVWLTYEQLDHIMHLLAAYRRILGEST
jgi:hypothetical protein